MCSVSPEAPSMCTVEAALSAPTPYPEKSKPRGAAGLGMKDTEGKLNWTPGLGRSFPS